MALVVLLQTTRGLRPAASPRRSPSHLLSMASSDSGAAIGKPKSLSPSALNDFSTCPLLFRIRHIDRRPEPVTPVLARGNVAHDALFEFFGLSREQRSLENLQNLFRLSWLKAKQPKQRNAEQYAKLFDTVGEEREWGLHGLNILRNYLELEDPTTFDPLSRELHLAANLTDDCALHGIIDRVDVDADGNLAVVDYKTGRAPDLKYSTATNRRILDSKFAQLKAYALLLQDVYGRSPTVLKLLYLEGPSLIWMPCNEDEVARTREEILQQWEAILYRVERQHFEPKVSKLCEYCFHQDICPAWNGDDDLRESGAEGEGEGQGAPAGVREGER